MLTKRFIEDQFPVSKISKESYTERKANMGQTLTGLGKWWGRKPLVMIRAGLLGMLMPASEDAKKDREIFLKLMTMDEEGLWRRKSKNLTASMVYSKLSREERSLLFEKGKRTAWKKGLSKEKKAKAERTAFADLSYDDKLAYCVRPEHIDGPSDSAWEEINRHLGTAASSLMELVQQLGNKAFGRIPRVGDVFCGGGSIPFEAVRLGCEAYGSDLSPVAALLTWAAIHIVGGGTEVQQEVRKAQEQAFAEADRQITAWGIEHNEKGWRADAYLYCVEAKSPATGLWVPLAPSWVISERHRVVAELNKNEEQGRYDIDIVEGADERVFQKAREGTVRNSRLVCPETEDDYSIATIRGDRKAAKSETVSGLRMWENVDLVPRPDDVFQERLYCIRWLETYSERGKQRTRHHYRAPDEKDLERERKVLELLRERFAAWQDKGYIPSSRIDPGDKTDEPIRTRGWTHWHHLFHPRQLLVHGLLVKWISTKSGSIKIAGLLGVGRACDYSARLTMWGYQIGYEITLHVFANQALNTFYNYGVRSLFMTQKSYYIRLKTAEIAQEAEIRPCDARMAKANCDIWITDPPYADAINYHELGEFFLSWYEKHLPQEFPDWYTDSKRALAVQGKEEDFKRSMVEIYRNLTQHMPDDGLQMVQFTHQNAAVWADIAMILWAAGLRVTAAWTIATETTSGLKKGNYVQGTVLLILRKRLEEKTAFTDELYPLVEDEVRRQLDHMLQLDDNDDPNFADTDYQLAAYAAALRVLTSFSEIEGHNIEHELFRVRKKGEKSEFELIIDRAVEIACDHLVPIGFDRFHWKSLSNIERLYLKGLELENHQEMRAGAYQELAKGFGVKEYTFLYGATKANSMRFKTPSEFKRAQMGRDGFGSTLLRQVLFSVAEISRTESVQEGLGWVKNEVPDYWGQRSLIITLLRYLASVSSVPHLEEHWKADTYAAELLAGIVQNDYVRD